MKEFIGILRRFVIWYVLDTQAGGFLDYNYGFTEVIDKNENHVADGNIISNYSYEELHR